MRPRTQSSVAISADGKSWFLLNASPDIRAQIENFPELHPASRSARNSPIEAVLVTNADLDHTLGLLLLREGEKLRVHATSAVRRALAEDLSFAAVLDSFCGAEWIEPPTQSQPLLRRNGSGSGLTYEAIPLPGKPPRFSKMKSAPVAGNVVGFRIVDEKTGGRLLFLPDVAALNENILGLLPDCDALLFDGTFWSGNEMRDQGLGKLSASDMGHLPISGATGSLKTLAQLPVRHKIYTHINNTNPILIDGSAEAAAVAAVGCTIGHDGMEIEI